MTGWHRKEVGDGIDAAGPSQRLHDAFVNLARAGGIQRGAAVFGRYDLRANMITWYFSPEVASLAQLFGATPCEKPEPQAGFSLNVGDADAWGFHFPGYKPRRRDD